MFRNSLRQLMPKRAIHSAPKLALLEEFSQNGIKGLFSAKQFNTSWTDQQQLLTDKLTLLTNGTADETRYPLQIALIASKDSKRQATFNYASQAFNNHFFTQQLTSPESNATKPSRRLGDRINAAFGSLEGLKENFIQNSKQVVGQGWIFLIEDENKNLVLKNLNNSGTPFQFNGNLSLDLSSPISTDDYLALTLVKKSLESNVEDYSLPLIGISLWDHSYLLDYGVGGREAYVAKVFDSLNWDVVNKRVFKL